MLVVHHLNNSRSQRVLWLLEELGLPYEIKRYQRDAKTMLAPPELKRVHPLGKSPVLEDGGRIYAESGAIIERVVDAHGAGRLRPPAGSDEADRYRFWMHYAEGSAMPPLLMALIFAKVRSAPMPFFAKPIAKGIADKVTQQFIAPQLRTHFDFVEAELGKSEWFAGSEFSAADIQMSFPVEAASVRAGGPARPRMAAFLQRIHARPAYQRALERGGPFELG
jgi:glutathione S-transferase